MAATSLVLSRKCDINARDGRLATPLLWATVSNRPEVIKFLLEHHAKTLLCDVTGKTALQYALQMNFSECAKLIKAYSNMPRY